jgi:glycosyltransferase involved in cell wall biosynthesis
MKFSIITPTYNRAYTITNTIRSVLNQSYSDWELLIVDDGSTDDTESTIATAKDSRIHYFFQDNAGPSSARNLALEKAVGDWVVYIDSDNELLSNYLDVLRIHIENEPQTKFAITKGVRTLELYHNNKLVDIIDDSQNYPEKVSLKDVYLRNVKFDINGFAHSREITQQGYSWDNDNYLMEDWDFFLQFADKYRDSFLYINIPLFHYHQKFGTDGLVSNATYQDWAHAFETIYQKHKDSPLMKNQTWYPQRVDKYSKLALEVKNGQAKPEYLKYFPNFQPKKF